MKVIENIELLKKLAPYLENITTDHGYYKGDLDRLVTKEYEPDKYIKTLHLEEVIDLFTIGIGLIKIIGGYECNNYRFALREKIYFRGQTKLEAVEKMLEYLLDNNLLGK